MKYSEMLAKLKADNARIIEIDDMAEVTEELKAEQDGLITACESLKGKIERKKAAIETEGYVADAEANTPVEPRVIAPAAIVPNEPKAASDKIPANVILNGQSARIFKGANPDLKAYRFGQFFRATLGIPSAMQYCADHGIQMAVHQEGVNTTGGYLVQQEFENSIIDLKLQYGVFRRNAENVPMSSDVKTQPRRTNGVSATWAGESTAATEDNMTWDQITYVAKKLIAMSRISNELSEDAVVSVAQKIMDEMAYDFALKEDTAGFTGTGLSSQGGITGVSRSLTDAAGVTGTAATAGGVVISAGNLAATTLANLVDVIATLPTYARLGAKWYASPYVFDSIMVKLATAAGGNNATDIVNGVRQPQFLGYPVELTEVMPTSGTAKQIVCLFGDLAKAAGLGDRRQTTIATSDSAVIGGESVFERDEIAIRATERLDINVHDVGNTTTAGPIVGLQQAS